MARFRRTLLDLFHRPASRYIEEAPRLIDIFIIVGRRLARFPRAGRRKGGIVAHQDFSDFGLRPREDARS